MTKKSEYICARCGCALTWWLGKQWKHVANAHTRSCGKPPHPVLRSEAEAEAAAIVKYVRER